MRAVRYWLEGALKVRGFIASRDQGLSLWRLGGMHVLLEQQLGRNGGNIIQEMVETKPLPVGV